MPCARLPARKYSHMAPSTTLTLSVPMQSVRNVRTSTSATVRRTIPIRAPFQPFGPKGQLLRPPPVHFSKTFRFAYQREYRFVSYPSQATERLDSDLSLTLGALDDIAELLVL